MSSNAYNNPSPKFSERVLRALCDLGLNSYKHLLTQEELSAVNTIMRCSVDGMCLLYSIYQRKSRFFFKSNCRVKLSNLYATVLELTSTKILVRCDTEDLSSLLQELSVKDLQRIIASQGMDSLLSSKDMNSKRALLSFFESILPFDSNRVQLFTVLCKEMETPLKLAPEIRSVLDVLELLYSPLSPSSAVVTSQLGLKRFPTYFLFPKIPFFSNRRLLDAFIAARNISQYFHSSTFSVLSSSDVHQILFATVSTLSTICVKNESTSLKFLQQIAIHQIGETSLFFSHWTQYKIQLGSCQSRTGNDILALIEEVKRSPPEEPNHVGPYNKEAILVNISSTIPPELDPSRLLENCIDDVFFQERFVILTKLFSYKAIFCNTAVKLLRHLQDPTELFYSEFHC